MRSTESISNFFNFFSFSTKGKSRVVSHYDVDKMLNAFTMHSLFFAMPSKNAVTMPFGTGAFLILSPSEWGRPQGQGIQTPLKSQKINKIHLITNQFNSL